ncbi:MAG: T9SS type A sorting domain-containing protein, partial [Bacteroidota bacterium]|nr:T9SS type A sorting domain-containing protein [Bacteroidota bacterium]
VSIFLCSIIVHSQIVSPEVVATAGGYVEGAGVSVSWTLGEISVETYTAGNVVLTQGFQQTWSTTDCQTMNFASGWSIFSSYINPTNPLLDTVFAPIVSNVIIIKNGNGQVYWPGFNLNMIGNMIIGEGYQINMSLQDMLNICGSAVVPEVTPINIQAGWSFIAYLRQSPASAEVMMSNIVSSLIILKNGNGQVYWPAFNLNMIGNMMPGQGYQINLSTAETLVYPANSIFSKQTPVNIITCQYFGQIHNSGANMTIGIPLSAWENMPYFYDEIGIFSSDGILVGSAVFDGKTMAIPIWGKDMLTKPKDGLNTDEAFSIVLWNTQTEKEVQLQVDFWIEGNGNYDTDKISVVGKFQNKLDNYILQLFSLQNYPNPCTSETTFEFYLPENSDVSIRIYNSLGEEIDVLFFPKLISGLHKFNLDIKSYSHGIYHYQFVSNDNRLSKQLIVL